MLLAFALRIQDTSASLLSPLLPRHNSTFSMTCVVIPSSPTSQSGNLLPTTPGQKCFCFSYSCLCTVPSAYNASLCGSPQPLLLTQTQMLPSLHEGHSSPLLGGCVDAAAQLLAEELSLPTPPVQATLLSQQIQAPPSPQSHQYHLQITPNW